ncbi:MAG: hypothetical protein WA837_09650 [Xanthobacteraceae bacterium]
MTLAKRRVIVPGTVFAHRFGVFFDRADAADDAKFCAEHVAGMAWFGGKISGLRYPACGCAPRSRGTREGDVGLRVVTT